MKRIPRLSVSEAAYSAVKQVLLSSKYSPGSRIDIDDLCRVLEVSRTPVFDALNRLEAEGIVEIIPRKGTYLVSFSKEKAEELYAVREILEGMATKLAAKSFTERHAETLRKALDRQSACLKNDDTEGYASATIKFHNTIAEAAGNKTLERLLETVYAQMEALRLRTLYLPGRLRKSFAEHQRIFDALMKRDPTLCEREARNHIRTTTTDALNIVTQNEKSKAAPKDLIQTEP